VLDTLTQDAARRRARRTRRCGSTSCARRSSTAASCAAAARGSWRDHAPGDGGEHASIVRDPTWHPTLGPEPTTFRMVDLLLFAFEGKKTLLAPLG
jgi:hypothetical protein